MQTLAKSPASLISARIASRPDLVFAAGLFGTILLLVSPIPSFVMDLLLAFSIASSLLIMLVVIYVRTPTDFSAFPTVLLGLTLFRLALNICSTRLVLTRGEAGNIINAFGNIVIQGNYVVGFVVFVILVVINFVVITKGAGRIAEVSARFTLDALPGKQMAIDAEMNAGVIDEPTATARRQKLQREVDFYGAMDGSSKFVRGEAIAGILITLVNILGGFTIGVLQMDLSLPEALQKFTLLSIGDGLVSQIPALVVSVAAGLLVTRAAENSDIGRQVGSQVMRYPVALKAVGCVMALMGLLPGLPLVPLALMGGLFLFLGFNMPAAGTGLEAPQGAAAEKPKSKDPEPNRSGSVEEVRRLIDVDVFAVEVGFGLVGLADQKQGGDLPSRITGVRKSLARELGIIIPQVAVRDNLELGSGEYRFLLRGRQVGKGTLMMGRLMAMNVSGSRVRLKGISCEEPVFKLPAVWIEESERKNAEVNGYSVVDCSAVIITHLSEVLKANAHHLIGRQDVQALVDHIKASHPALVSEVLPDLVNLGVIQRVLQNLLREGVPILNFPLILEGIADYASLTKNPDDLSELVRRRVASYFIQSIEANPGVVRAISLDLRLEKDLSTKIHRTATDIGLALDPGLSAAVLASINDRAAQFAASGSPPCLVVGAELRLPLRRFLEPSFPRLVVLSFQEIPSNFQVENLGIVQVASQPAAAAA
jgi:flagellar biosynthesis protein FlhA